MTSPEKKPDPLAPILKDAEDELSRRLHEACEAEASGLENKTSEEIRAIEDSLLAAAVAAGQTIALRRHMHDRDEAAREQKTRSRADREVPRTVAREDVEAPLDDSTLEALPEHARVVREFRDSNGQMWRAWPVVPGLSRTGSPRHYLGDYKRGWICFESLDSPARRRLPCAPARLAETKEEELERLLAEAITAPERRRTQGPH